VSRDVKVAAIESMFEPGDKKAKGAKGKAISQVTQNLMVTMAGNNRIGDAGKVADAFVQLMKVQIGSPK
jgi:F0F1-type ATP synthase delta subunit